MEVTVAALFDTSFSILTLTSTLLPIIGGFSRRLADFEGLWAGEQGSGPGVDNHNYMTGAWIPTTPLSWSLCFVSQTPTKPTPTFLTFLPVSSPVMRMAQNLHQLKFLPLLKLVWNESGEYDCDDLEPGDSKILL